MIKKIRNHLSTPIGHFLLNKRVDDIYLAAYPRSGSTWLRTILVNILDPSAKSDPDRFNARIPAVSIRNASVINKLQSPRLIMTHSCWRPSIKKAVYLIRDGRDAFISTYHYHTTRNEIDMSIEEYYRQYSSGVYGVNWEKNINSWVLNGKNIIANDLLIIKFEELKKNTYETILKVCKFIEIEAENELIKSAIFDASIQKAKEIEKQRQGNISDSNASFYRVGDSNQWKKMIYSDVIKQFEINAEQTLKYLGYAN